MLKRVTKTIPLSGGQQDEAPEFLLEPPGMAYLQNARFTKADYAEKTEPIESIGGGPILNDTGPEILFNDNETLVTISEDQLIKYDGTSWTSEQLNSEVTGINQILSTIEESGGSNYTWAPFGVYSGVPAWTHSGYCVAFERRTHGDVSTPDSSLVINRYNLDGTLSESTVMGSDLWSPCAQSLTNGNVNIFYVDGKGVDNFSGDLRRVTVAPPPLAAPSGSTLEATTVMMMHQAFDSARKWVQTSTAQAPDRLRIGYIRNAHKNSAIKYKQHYSSTTGVVAYKKTNGNIYVQYTSASGITLGAETFLQDDVGDNVYSLLDVDIDDTFYYLLMSVRDTATDTTSVYAKRYSRASPIGTQKNIVLATGTDFYCYQGSMVVFGGDARVAFRRMEGDPTTFGFANASMETSSPNGASEVVIRSVFADWAGTQLLRNFPDYTLASNIILDDNDEVCMVLQQFSNFTPDNGQGTIDCQGYSTTPASVKPVSSILVRVPESGDLQYEVIAMFDQGQSKDKDASYAEQNIQYGDLYYAHELNDGISQNYKNSFWYGNRVLLTAEDILYWNGNSYVAGSSPFKKSQLVGETRCSIYQVSSRIEPTASVVNNSFIYNSAVPLYYTNGGLIDLSFPDQPEVTYLRNFDYDGAIQSQQGVAYNETGLGIGDQQVRYYQVVCGYYDANGEVHRSAPSFPVFARKNVQENNYNNVTIGYTRPLLFAQPQCFAELYEGTGGDVPQLAGVRHFDSGDLTLTPDQNISSAIMSEVTVGSTDIPRSSESIYTAGDTLPVDPWPTMKQTVSTPRRLFGISEAAPGSIFYSKLFEENVAPEFSASLVINLGAFRDLTALGRVDDKVIVFEKNRMHIVHGSGPDNTGANGDFFVEEVQTVIGCEDPGSVLTVPDGLMFRSSVTDEFHLLTRDLQLQDIGKPIIDYPEPYIVRDALLYENEHEARFYLWNQAGSSGDWGPDPDTGAGVPPRPPRPRFERSMPVGNPCLVYNYQYQKWTILTNHPFDQVAIYDNKPAGINNIYGASITSSDWALAEAMTWETPWIKVNQLQDYGRFWEATFLGKYLSSWSDNGNGFESGDLKITIKYDYEGLNGTEDEVLFRANVDFDPVDGERLQFRVKPGRQKCQAIKFIIEEQLTTKIDDAEPDYTLGRGFALDAIDLVYGAKGGSSRNFGRRRQK